MPGKVKVKIISGKNLPVMDRSSDTTDAYVEIKLGGTTYKTDVCRKSLHPQWNSEWYRFEVDDSELQDEPLQIRLMDHDTYSANDAIGKVYLNLNPLLLPAADQLVKYNYNGENATNHDTTGNSVMSGWIPVYDTMHGIRGEVNITVKVELFSDFNRFRQSSCGVQFYCSPTVPQGYFAQMFHGFVEELIVDDDPEYQWIDKIRTPRASNEARQTLFFKLSGELQRKIGVKALDLGGNAVIGYNQQFDLEGECGIVARGIGTAVTLIKTAPVATSIATTAVDEKLEERSLNYLKFVGCDKSFRLNAKPKSGLFIPFPTPRHPFRPKIYEKSLVKPNYNFTRHLSYNEHLRSTQSNPTLNDDHSSSFKTLLKQEDRRGTPGHGFSQKLKNLKYSSHSSLSKKMTALKAKLGDAGIGEENEEYISNLPLDANKKRKLFKRTHSETSSAMAELLARSVIQAHNSLSCILEVQNSPHNTDSETETLDKLEPIANLIQKTVSEPNISSDDNASEMNERSYSSSESSSSDYDFDMNTRSQTQSYQDFDTISNILSNVELLERNEGKDTLTKQYSLPTLACGRNSLLDSELESRRDVFCFPTDSEDNASIATSYLENDNEDTESNIDLSQTQEENQTESDKEEQTKSAVFSFEDQDELDNEPEPEETKEDVSILSHSAPAQVPERFTHSNIIIPPVMIGASVKPKGLIKTAMQTMLLEKVNIIGTYTPPTSPTFYSNDYSCSNVRNRMFYSPFANSDIDKPIKKSCTSASFSDYVRKNDTVLGVPFTHISQIKNDYLKRQQSHPCLSAQQIQQQQITLDAIISNKKVTRKARHNCFSDSELNKPKIDAFPGVHSPKHRFKFFNLLNKTRSYDSSLNKSEKHVHKRKFSLFHKKRDKSADDIHKRKFIFKRTRKASENDTEGKEKKNIISKIFTKTDKNAGNIEPVKLEETKLQQQQPQQSPPQSASIVPNFPSSSILLTNTNTTDVSNTNSPKVELDNSKIDSSVYNSNMPACLTPNRNSTWQQEQQTTTNGCHSPENTTKMSHSPAKLNAMSVIHRRSSDSDLSITPKGNSLTGSDRSGGATGSYFIQNNMILRPQVHKDNFDMLEYPFLTMSKFPPGFILQIGGAVSARSVKLLERITNVEEPESRDTWWSELRMEIRSHARSLNCNAVLGYCETTSICDDVCVLSAHGTAAVIGFLYCNEIEDTVGNLPVIQKGNILSKDIMTTSLDRTHFDKERNVLREVKVNANKIFENPDHVINQVNPSCTISHLPYDTNNVPIRSSIVKCGLCSKGKVPDVLIATIEPPENVPSVGRGCFLESFVCRPLKDLRGESIAKDISDGLPFLEYELHRLLVNKLKIKGMNAIFGLKIRISIGEKMLIGIATGTAIFLSSLPSPAVPKLVSDRNDEKKEKKLANLQKELHDAVKKNRDIYQLKEVEENQNGRILSDNEDSEDEPTSLDLSLGNKDCCVLEVDDPQDVEVLNLLMEKAPPDGFHVVNTETVPGLEDLEIVKNLQMFTQIYRAKILPSFNLNKHFRRLLDSVYFKLRRMVPCALCDLQFRVDLPEQDEIQLCVIGMALGLGKTQRKTKTVTVLKKPEEDLIFKLDEDQPEKCTTPPSNQNLLNASHSLKLKQRSPSKNRPQSIKQRHIPYTQDRHGVDITPLSYVPGARIERYLGNLNFFFIRETTSIREEGGLSGFIHSFVTEVLAIVRAHVTALGGNAMVAYFLTECVLNHNLHKNQGQCLINVGGDVVFVSYFKEDT